VKSERPTAVTAPWLKSGIELKTVNKYSNSHTKIRGRPRCC